MDMTLEDIKSKSKNVFKKMVKTKMKEFSLNYLNTLKEKHSKMDNLVYPKLKTQNYLKNGEINVQAAKNLFKWRTRAAHFKMNYSNSYEDTSCPSCLAKPDTQAHFLECSVFKHMTVVMGDYLDIFQEDVPNDRYLKHPTQNNKNKGRTIQLSLRTRPLCIELTDWQDAADLYHLFIVYV